jgi:hypothetical protein
MSGAGSSQLQPLPAAENANVEISAAAHPFFVCTPNPSPPQTSF